ncbi:MAG: hypothetical protein ACOYD9_03085 [Pyramidobacter sp.]|jgi:choline-glycine betaine transporter
MTHLSLPQPLFPAALLVLLVLFSLIGFKAMGPRGTERDIKVFWCAICLFLALLALYLGLYFSPVLAVAPLVPLFIFVRLFITTRGSSKSSSQDTEASRDSHASSSQSSGK